MDPRLQYLRDLELPVEPSWWPPAPGWWLATLLVAAALVWLMRRLYTRHLQQRPYRRARQELEALQRALESGAIDGRRFVDGANALVKRLCIHVRGETDVARLSGAEWLAYLDRIAGADVFTQGPGAVLGAPRYAPRFEIEPRPLHEALHTLLGRLEAQP
jgi:hypothetical protein